MPDLWELQAESKCPYPLCMLTDRSIGDMVMAFAALQILAERYAQVVLFTNIAHLISSMAPPNANHHLGWLPYHAQAELFNISVGSSMNPRYGHPIRQILDHIGVESPAPIPQPRWNEKIVRAWWDTTAGNYRTEPIEYPQYDFLLHVNSDDKDRLWPFPRWADLIDALREQYPECSIGILGSDQVPPWNHHRPDPRPLGDGLREAPEDGRQPEHGVEYVYNRSFALVGSLLKRAKKAVITIDSSVSRIAHAVGCRNHVLLAPTAYPLEWSCHPACYPAPGAPDQWTVDTVMAQVARAAAQDDEGRFGMPPERRVDASALWQLRHLCSTWSLWPRNGDLRLRLVGGFGAVGDEVDFTRLSQQQADHLVELAQRSGLFSSIVVAQEPADAASTS